MYTEPHADYQLVVKINDGTTTAWAEFWYAGFDEAYNVDAYYSDWFEDAKYVLTDSNGFGPEGFTTWEAAKAAFLEAVSQQVMLDSARKTEVTR